MEVVNYFPSHLGWDEEAAVNTQLGHHRLKVGSEYSNIVYTLLVV